MNKCIVKFLSIIIALLAMNAVVHAGTLGTVDFSPVSASGYDATYCIDDVVFIDAKPNIPGVYEDVTKDGRTVWLLKYEANPEAFRGAKVYAMGRGKLWSGGKKARTVNVKAALGMGEITNSKNVTVHMTHPADVKPDYCLAAPKLVEFKGGERAWYVPYGSAELIGQNRNGEDVDVEAILRTQGKVVFSQYCVDQLAKQD